ncbi:MAG TPA: helix-turn-helix transcriptional regulator [Candidatus Limnocylindrales bacterium]
MSDDYQIGRIVRDLRLARGLRQEDVAARAGVGRQTIYRLERGLIDGMTVGTLRTISKSLEMPSIVSLGWRLPEIDRLRDRLHASTVDQSVALLASEGWETRPEHSFNYFGERGSVDILAWHAAHRALLIVEVKTRLWDIQDLLAVMDKKRRLLPGLARRELGWNVQNLGLLLVMPELSTHRHVIGRHAATFRAALPQRQLAVRVWLSQPSGNLNGVLFLPNAHDTDIRQRTGRSRAPRISSRTRRSPDTG